MAFQIIELFDKDVELLLQKGLCRMKTTQYNLYGRAKLRLSPVKSFFMDLDFFLRSYSAALKAPVPVPVPISVQKNQKNKN